MSNTQLIHLIYASTATGVWSKAELIDFLTSIRKNNIQADVTGMLLYSESDFFQILEGQEQTVNQLFSLIDKDPRHNNVTMIINEPIAQRSFAEWSMGFMEVNDAPLAEIAGLNDYFTTGSCFANLNAGRAKKILQAFSKGHWRQSIK